MALSFNLVDQLAFYGAYHANKWNQLIHFIFVPAIIWSICVWLAGVGPLVSLPATLEGLPSYVALNVPFVAMAVYALFYLSLEPLAGLSWSVCVGAPIWLTSTAFATQVDGAAKWAAAVQLLSWYMQIHPGHMVLEKRKPALMDSMVQAFALAPLFVWCELLFALGYRKRLQREVNNRVGKDIAAWRKQQNSLKAK